jgi:hypothetical protein
MYVNNIFSFGQFFLLIYRHQLVVTSLTSVITIIPIAALTLAAKAGALARYGSTWAASTLMQ